MGFYLEVRSGGQRLDPYSLEGERVVVGRHPGCDLVLPDPHVSREQFAIELGETCRIVDLGGKNPVRVNGHSVESAELAEGDRIEVGSTEIELRNSATPEGSPASAVAVVQREISETAHRVSLGADTLISASLSDAARVRLDVFYRLAETMAQSPDPDTFLGQVLDNLFGALPAQRGFVALGDPRQGNFQPVQVRNDTASEDATIEMSRTILDEIQLERKAMLVQDAPTEIPGSQSVLRIGIHGFLCAPLFAGDDFLGVIYVDQVDARVPFSEEDLVFMNGIGRLVALGLDNLQLSERLRKENSNLRAILQRRGQLVARCDAMLEVLSKIQRLGGRDSSVLITGETGTGKELVARAIHDASPRKDGPFVAFNCSMSNPALIENELFGHVKGSYTDAHADTKGKFEQANGGTLFLDEIGDMPLETQVKILRVIQERRVEPIGGQSSVPIDIRIVCATHKDLAAMRKDGSFRDDLFYRLAVLSLELPPLRERGDDILEIAQSFLPEGIELEPSARKGLLGYDWPGNVRELQNVIEQASFNAGDGNIRLQDLPAEVAAEGRRARVEVPLSSLREVEASHIRKVLAAVGGNKKRAAEILGISRETLYQKIKLYEL